MKAISLAAYPAKYRLAKAQLSVWLAGLESGFSQAIEMAMWNAVMA